MNSVYLVYVIYQYDGYDDTDVFSSKEKAAEHADLLLNEFKQEGYEIINRDKNATFKNIKDPYIYFRLGSDYGELDIILEEEAVK